MAEVTLRETIDHDRFTGLYRQSELEIEPGWETLCRPVMSFCAEQEGELLGAATVSFRLERMILDYIAVVPIARGLGIGRLLTEACLRYASGSGEKTLWLAARTPGFFRAMHALETGETTLLAECLECPDYQQGCSPVEMKFIL